MTSKIEALSSKTFNKLPGLMRSHNCGEIRKTDVDQEVVICGWLNKVRDLGGLYFLDVRDKFGLTQVNFEAFEGDRNLLKGLPLESVVKVKGKVRLRPESAQNAHMPTGEVEVLAAEFEILSRAQEVPFLPHGQNQATEDLRLKYRYIDLRSEKLQKMLFLRSEVARLIRESLYEEGFTEVETPILYKSTPEGARDYIVPSRVHPGKVYALPQSPQTLKQLLMIGNTDKYFQIVKCFRDEDLRADRQPEFTQVDLEVSFMTPTYIKNLIEKLVRRLFPVSADFQMPTLSYDNAMALFGSDKPDLRFSLAHIPVTHVFENSTFQTFKDIADKKGLIKGIFWDKSYGELTRKDVDELTEVVKPHGGKGVAWFKLENDQRSGGISKFVDISVMESLKMAGEASLKEVENLASFIPNKLQSDFQQGQWLFCADADHDRAHACADAVRRHLAKKFKLIPENQYAFVWIYDFPLLEFNSDDGRFYAKHHPFTSPHDDDLHMFMSGDPEQLKKCRAFAYDFVCNGYEVGGGSIRIFRNEVQSQMFKVLGLTEEETLKQFGFFVEALKYGTPPHGGLALGLDRLLMLVAGTDNIRDVISFPKTASATDLMCSCPTEPNPAQLKELHFSWNQVSRPS